MHLKGLGTPVDITQATAMYNAASMAGNLLAAYNLAVLHLRGMAGEVKGPSACKSAVAQLKRVSERAWPALAEANDDFASGEYEWALLNYLKAAEWGSELGQSNAAWMLSEGYGYEGPLAGVAAVSLFRRAAEQGNSAAFVRLGDSYWYGKGVPRDWVRAGRAYSQAARHRIPQALFNLGYMHQHGAGVAKDLHLAKRYYDRASAAADDAWLASAMALVGLQLQAWWERVEHRFPAGLAWFGRVLVNVLSGGRGVHVRPRSDVAPSHHAGPGGGRDVRVVGINGRASMEGRMEARREGRYFSVSGILMKAFDGVDALFSDSTTVVWVVGLLALVLWRRQALRARIGQQQRQQVWEAPPTPVQQPQPEQALTAEPQEQQQHPQESASEEVGNGDRRDDATSSGSANRKDDEGNGSDDGSNNAGRTSPAPSPARSPPLE